MRNDGDGQGPADRPGQPKDKGPSGAAQLPTPAGPPQLPKEDPDAPPTEEERRLAAALREALLATEEAAVQGPGGTKKSGAAQRLGHKSEEGRWLAAHLRLPTAHDALGEVRARGLARAAREALLSRRAEAARRDRGWRQLGRTLGGTGALLLAAAALLIVSWGLFDQGVRLQRGLIRPMPRATTALLLRSSLQRNESPTERLDLMMRERLQQLRAAPLKTSRTAVASQAHFSALRLFALSAADRGGAGAEAVR